MALAAFAALAAIVAALVGNGWLQQGRELGDDEQAEAGADLMLGATVAFAAAAAAGVLGGFLFFLGSSLLRRFEARTREGVMPPLPDD